MVIEDKMINYLKKEMLQSFKTNDGVELRFVDTGAGSGGVGGEGEGADGKEWLILVSGFCFIFDLWVLWFCPFSQFSCSL